MHIALIAALSQNDVIGHNNALPWRLRADLRRFRALTLHHPLLLGRRTYDSIGKALPGRTNIALTRDPAWSLPGVAVAHSLPEALTLAAATGADTLFVGGGAALYAALLPQATQLYLTRVEAVVEGDTFFPAWDRADWLLESSEAVPADAENEWPSRFEVWTRG